MSAVSQSGSSDGFRRVSEDGEEYLVHDVIGQKEGVYEYPDGRGTRKEFAPSSELRDAVESVDSVPLILTHPESAGNGLDLLSNPEVDVPTVGEWRSPEPRGDNKIGGEVWIPEDEIGRHNGVLETYVNQVERTGFGEVSTGYQLQTAEHDPGRHNGEDYTYVQRGIQLDHLALLPDKPGDCSVENGCGLGRANTETMSRLNSTANETVRKTVEALTRTNALSYAVIDANLEEVSYTDDMWDGSEAEAEFPNPSKSEDAPEYLDQVYMVHPTDESNRDAKDNWKLPIRESPDAPVNTRALVQIDSVLSGGRGGVEGLSEDVRDEVSDLTERMRVAASGDLYGSLEERQNWAAFGRTVYQGLTSDECGCTEDLSRGNEVKNGSNSIVEKLKSFALLEDDRETPPDSVEETRGNENMSDENGDGGDPETIDEEQVREIVQEEVGDVVKEELEDFDPANTVSPEEVLDNMGDELVQQVEEARANERHIEKVAQSEDVPLEREDLERMNSDVVADLAEDIEEEEETEERVNMAGQPQGRSFDPSEYQSGDDDYDIPAPGSRRIGGGE